MTSIREWFGRKNDEDDEIWPFYMLQKERTYDRNELDYSLRIPQRFNKAKSTLVMVMVRFHLRISAPGIYLTDLQNRLVSEPHKLGSRVCETFFDSLTFLPLPIDNFSFFDNNLNRPNKIQSSSPLDVEDFGL